MADSIYPWGGKFTSINPGASVALVTLSEDFDFTSDKIALYGNMKTENLGVEKVAANIISNPNIRYLIVCGDDVRGHRSGDAILKLHKNGIDYNRRVVGAKSAIPYIENLSQEAISRFQKQVEVIDLIGVSNPDEILSAVDKCTARNTASFGEPMIVAFAQKDNVQAVISSDFCLHSEIRLDPYGIVSPLEVSE
jgi:tetrahydromethanopterin S-methyltransferase subunit A